MVKNINEIKSNINSACETARNHAIQIQNEYERVSDFATNPDIVIADIDDKFKRITKLNGIDITFLVTAIALQVVRQYIITPFKERTDADSGSKIMDEKYKEKLKFEGTLYYATEETITKQKKVPFDIIAGSKEFELGGKGKGLSGNTHRFRSLGHDPVLGYIYGTANILTNTATWWNGNSHHIMYMPNKRGVDIPTIAAFANTHKIFQAVKNRFWDKTETETRILVEAITKEHLHLKSDNTTDGLPLPFLQKISPDFTQNLAEHGIDAISIANVGKQASVSELINFIIAVVHGLLCAETEGIECRLYKVRTKKIILISNAIASTSNLIAVGLATGIGISTENPELAKKALRYADIGGLLVTIRHLFTDTHFISKVKEEFIKNEVYNHILGTEYDFVEGEY